MRGVVVIRQVVHEEVEAVARDQPAADERCVGIDRAERAVAHGDRRTGAVALVERVEEEPSRPVHCGHAGNGREVTVPSAVARDVDRGRRQPFSLERLVHRLRVAAEMARVQVDDRVAQ